MKKYELWYTKEAPKTNDDIYIFAWENNNDDDGWERWSLPIGNGYMGVNVFGRTEVERCQITENSLANPYYSHKDFPSSNAGLNNFCELMLDFGHPFNKVKNYKRGLRLNDAIAYANYEYNGIEYTREYFTSYPDRIFAIKLNASCSNSISLTVKPQIPGIGNFAMTPEDGYKKTGNVSVNNNIATISGVMEHYNVLYEGRIMVLNDGGDLTPNADSITITNANSVVILVAVGTNYKLESKVFLEDDPSKKLSGYDTPHKMVCDLINAAQKKGYDDLKKRHVKDFGSLFERVSLDLNGTDEGLPTDELVKRYKSGTHSQYLEALYFVYGRYLLISSSRPGTYPSSLQGTWNRYTSSPWSSGYWHNINVQMNYWPAFNTNLSECFIAYINYFLAYKPLVQRLASEYIKKHFPDKYEDGETNNGWNIGTGAWLYTVEGNPAPLTSHSGPSTGAFTADLFWEYYAFTGDKKFLQDVGYPMLRELSLFLSKVLVEEDGKLLTKHSASPEQIHNGSYYYTKGCAFDQQMLYENYLNTIKAAEVLGIEDDFIKQLKQDITKLDPVQVGKSGQIKEYREEEYYGDIGEKNHRHISHLVGLYPGTLINQNHPEWLEAARTTLNLRGDESTGWSTAHKINAWARTKDGSRAYDLVKMIISNCTGYNLWDLHPPFQIDGNLGASAGIAEMLLQSHEGYIHILPAIPTEWQSGSFSGLCARGGFEIGAIWENGKITKINILSKLGGTCKIYVGDEFKNSSTVNGFITLETKPNESIELC